MDRTSKKSLVGRILGFGAVTVVVLLVVGLFGIRWWVVSYLQSEKFRRFLNEKTSAAMQAQGEYLPLHWSGGTAFSDGFHAQGLPGSPVGELRADLLRADLDLYSLLQRKCRIDGLSIERLQVRFVSPAAVPAGGASGRTASSAGLSVKVELSPIRVQEANLSWPMSGGTTGLLRRAGLVLSWNDGGWDTSVTGGELMMMNWPLLFVDQAQLRSRRDALYVTDGRLRLVNGGNLVVNGEVHFDGAREFNVTGRFADVPVANWLPEAGRGQLVGQARGDGRVQGGLNQGDALRVEGTITLVNGRLQALPVLDKLAVFTQTEQFRRIELQKGKAEFVWKAGRLEVKNLLMESTGLLRVEGGCVVENEKIDGVFDVGVAASTLRWLPGARGKVFTVDRDGYLWTKVKIDGPLKNIKEDLSERLLIAAGTEILDGTQNTLEKGAQMLMNLLK
jgi:hypothetical protein